MSSAREKIIVRTSIIGILANIILASLKALIGILANSIAIITDAINNLSDALSSIITIIGTKLAGKPPDRNHPYGYGRIEYITSLIVSSIVLYAGITALIESAKKFFYPEAPNYQPLTIIILIIGIIIKLVLGLYVKNVIAGGKKLVVVCSFPEDHTVFIPELADSFDPVAFYQKNLLTKVKNFSAGFYISHDSIFMYNNKAGIVIRPGRTCSDHSLLIDCHYSRVIDSQELI